MANEISLVTASGRTVTPKDDGIIYEVFSPGNGIIYGGAVTIKDSSTLHITAGHGIVCGRKFTIDDSDIPVALSGSGSLLGRLYIHLDLADAADPITLLVETGASLTPVVQDADVNINNGVYEINLATFDVDTSTISNLVTMDVSVKPMGDMEGATSALDGKGGYVPAPQAGDEDKVLRGDGTWGSAGDTATVRYNETTDHFDVLFNGSWVQSIRAFVQSIAVWVAGLFGVSVENGVYDPTSGNAIVPFTISDTHLVANYGANVQRFTLVTELIDFTNYSYVNVKTSQGNFQINVSSISGSYYLGIVCALFYGTSQNGNITACVTSTKSAFLSNAIASNQVAVPVATASAYISEITIE